MVSGTKQNVPATQAPVTGKVVWLRLPNPASGKIMRSSRADPDPEGISAPAHTRTRGKYMGGSGTGPVTGKVQAMATSAPASYL